MICVVVDVARGARLDHLQDSARVIQIRPHICLFAHMLLVLGPASFEQLEVGAGFRWCVARFSILFQVRIQDVELVV